LRAILCIFSLFGIIQAAEWGVLVENVMTIAIGASAPDAETVYVSGADNGVGAIILKSSDAGNTWLPLPHDPQMMYLDVDVAKGTTFGVAPAIGIFGVVSGSSYTETGEEFISTPDTNFVFASQSAVATDSQHYYMAAAWQRAILDDYFDGVVQTNDGGKTMNYWSWGMGTQARYGTYPSNSTWFISGGTWPSDYDTAEEKRQGIHALSPRIKVHFNQQGKQVKTEINTDPSVMGNADGYLGVLARTRNGGATFELVYNDTGRFYFNGIDCADERRCWAVAEGPDGSWILHSDDSGDTWKEQWHQANSGLFDIKMINALEGWACGAGLSVTFNAIFLHTTNGGITWTNEGNIRNAWPNSISIVNSERAYATAFLLNGLSSILSYQ